MIMKTRDAILLTIGIALLELLFAIKIGNALVPVGIFLNAGMALWAAIDSSKIHLRLYKSGIACHPVVLLFGIACLWIIGFPWYLSVRYKIKMGTAILKDEATNVAA
jgi:hypothetical protein